MWSISCVSQNLSVLTLKENPSTVFGRGQRAGSILRLSKYSRRVAFAELIRLLLFCEYCKIWHGGMVVLSNDSCCFACFIFDSARTYSSFWRSFSCSWATHCSRSASLFFLICWALTKFSCSLMCWFRNFIFSSCSWCLLASSARCSFCSCSFAFWLTCTSNCFCYWIWRWSRLEYGSGDWRNASFSRIVGRGTVLKLVLKNALYPPFCHLLGVLNSLSSITFCDWERCSKKRILLSKKLFTYTRSLASWTLCWYSAD